MLQMQVLKHVIIPGGVVPWGEFIGSDVKLCCYSAMDGSYS